MSIKRNDGESFADFKERRISDNEQTRLALKPKLFWNSYYEGTYVNKEKQQRRKHIKMVGKRALKKIVMSQKGRGTLQTFNKGI